LAIKNYQKQIFIRLIDDFVENYALKLALIDGDRNAGSHRANYAMRTQMKKLDFQCSSRRYRAGPGSNLVAAAIQGANRLPSMYRREA
jgi:hypothetical protein